jgi:hypothetical protein
MFAPFTLVRKSRGAAAQRKHPSQRPSLEILEARIVFDFGPPSTYGVGIGPSDVASGDFNGDGRADLVTANRTANTVTVLLGNGNGTFQTGKNFPAGSGPSKVAIGDLNGDGHKDLVTGNPDSSKMNVLLGNGDGTFQAPVGTSITGTVQSVALGDLNLDGKLDAVLGLYLPGGASFASVLLGNGNGTFQAPQNYPAGNAAVDIAVADLNHDLAPDLVTAGWSSGTVSVLMGLGDGTFQSPVTYAAGSDVISVAVPDANGDGIPDLATANFDSSSVSLLLGKGDGTFLPAVNTGVNGSTPEDVAAADLNGDGMADLVTANFSSNDLSVLVSKGNGTFQAPVKYSVGSGPFSVAAPDVNGDHAPDLVVANLSGNTVSVLLNLAAATHFKVSATATTTAGNRFRVTVTALDSFNNVFTNYKGTVHFTSTDGKAILPSDYTFTAGDNGKHTFTVVLKTAGSQTVSATDTQVSSITGSAVVSVSPAAAKVLNVFGFPSPVTAGTVHTFTVTAKDAFGNVATGYQGTVHFTSSDTKAILPEDYTFGPADSGTKVLGAVLNSIGTQDMTGTDTLNATVTGTQSGIVVVAPPGPPSPPSGPRPPEAVQEEVALPGLPPSYVPSGPARLETAMLGGQWPITVAGAYRSIGAAARPTYGIEWPDEWAFTIADLLSSAGASAWSEIGNRLET